MIYGVGEVLNRFMSFLLLPLFTSYLTPADYGIASLLGLLAFLLTPVFSLGFGAALGACYFEGDQRERKETAIWTAFFILAVSVSALAVFGTLFSKQISQVLFQTPAHSDLVTISIFSTCLAILVTPFRLYLQFEEKAKTAVAVTTTLTILSIGLSLLTIVVLRRGVRGMIESNLITQIASLVLLFSLAVREVRIKFRSVLGRELLRLGIPLIPTFAFVFVIQQGNKYILQWYQGLEVVGVYTIGFNLGLFLGLIVTGFQTAWTPYFMSFIEKKDEARLLFGRILTYYVLGVGSLSLLFFIFARPVVMLMTRPPFYEAYKIVGLSACAQFLTGAFSIFLPSVYFAKEIKYISFVQLAAAILSVVLNLLLIPSLGLLGAGFALMFGMFAMAGLQHLWNLNKRNTYFNVKYEWNRILWFAALYIAVVILMLWKRSFSLRIEILLSCLAALILSTSLFFLLNATEKRSLRALSQQLAAKSLNRKLFGKYHYES